LVVDEAKTGNDTIVADGRKIVGVMQKDSEKFVEASGWGFEGFKSDTKECLVTDAKGVAKPVKNVGRDVLRPSPIMVLECKPSIGQN